MQNSNNIYPLFWNNIYYLIVPLLLIIVLILAKLFGSKLIKKINIKNQKKIVKKIYENKLKIISNTIEKINVIQTEYNQGKTTTPEAAERLSNVVRTGFDELMNHNTLSSSKQEIINLNLKSIANISNSVYPAEFSNNQHHKVLNDNIFEESKEAIKACL